ncbi:hypothetical protein [Kordia jejudonensis]|uniref:hypothetical protein n=1 Tax=Kordia jejudonensis TaxID=1348245 RepID=UPI000629BEEA|nr:hypothetical protein [Kordia jejudonensis]
MRILIKICCVCWLLVACHNDDIDTTKNILAETPQKVQIKKGTEVSKKAIEYIKQKTNNTFSITTQKNSVKLATVSFLSKNTPLGIIDTSKEIVVINETNTKHTFKIIDPNDTNVVINLIIVETENTIYEYFLKYSFNGSIPYNDEGTAVDFSRFNGTIETFDADGNAIGSITVSEGIVTDDQGQFAPCPDEPVDDTSNTNDEPSGGTTSSSSTSAGIPGSDTNGTDTSTDNTGNGGWFASSDNDDCGLRWSYADCGCGIQYANGHSPSGHACCNGSALVVTDCNGIHVAQRNVSNSSLYVKRNPTDPCDDGDVGVILTDDELCNMDIGSFNTYYSSKSPFNVDLSEIRIPCDSITLPTNENKKFLCIYNKLTQLPAFKNLFTNTFGESMEANVTFKLEDLPDDKAGRNEADVGNVRNQVIVLNKNHFSGDKHPLTNAQTIIHECVHAYLKVKAYECSSGTSVVGLNNQELDELLNQFDYGCLSTAVNEHSLMFDILVPYMQQILNDIQPDLVATEDQSYFYNFYWDVSSDEPEQWHWENEQDAQGNLLEGCLFYMTLSGLEQANAFNQEITSDERHEFLFNKYNTLINNEGDYQEPFNFDTCNE